MRQALGVVAWGGLLWALGPSAAWADGLPTEAVPSPTPAASGPWEAAPPDFVPANRRLSPQELAKKRSGLFLTGLPALSSDPLSGVGLAFNGALFWNGERGDRLFAYTPYAAKLNLQLQQTTLNTSRLQLALDAPYVADSPWRLRLDLKAKNDPNKLFFGLTESTLASLPGGSFAAYQAQLARIRPGQHPGEAPEVGDALLNRFREVEWMGNAKLERSLFDGNWRLLMGYELQHLSYPSFLGTPVSGLDPATGQSRQVPAGRSRLEEGVATGEVVGAQGGIVSLIQSGLIYDTRDFEPDPTRGLVLELANEFANPVIGSAYAFDKLLLRGQHYHRLWPERLAHTVLATRVGWGNTFGEQAPFFEYQDQWSTEGSINALGGAQTLRGYKANRFLGRSVGFANLELRHRFAEAEWLGQNLSFGVVPFLDAGLIGDRPFQLRWDQPRASIGTGLRVGWNRSTVVLLNLAASQEDTQFFINFNQSY